MELVQRVDGRVVHGGSRSGHLRDGGVHLRRVDVPRGDPVGQRGLQVLLGGARRLHPGVQIGPDLLHGRPLLGRDAERVEAHGDEEHHAAVVVVAVVLDQTGRGVVVVAGAALAAVAGGGALLPSSRRTRPSPRPPGARSKQSPSRALSNPQSVGQCT